MLREKARITRKSRIHFPLAATLCGWIFCFSAGGTFASQAIAASPCSSLFSPSNDQEIEKSLERDGVSDGVVQKFGSRSVGEFLARKVLYRKKFPLNKRDRERGESLFQAIQKQPVILRFHSEDVKSVLELGFLNQFQVPYSKGGRFDRKLRHEQIMEITGTKFQNPSVAVENKRGTPSLENSVDEVRPKYGMLLPNHLLSDPRENVRDPKWGINLWDPAGNYGDVIAVLKDEVKRQSTFTFGDTVTGAVDLKKAVFSFFDDAHGTEGKFVGNPESSNRILPQARYIEVQVWGRLDVTDVEEFWVKPNAHPELVEALLSAGKRVYQYRTRNAIRGRLSHILYETRSLTWESDGSAWQAPLLRSDHDE
jgi:hypothetical protein